MVDMGINTTEFIVIALIFVVIVGPEKLPELAAQLARLIREGKAIATGAKARVQEELGPDFEELKNLDPRQYDPRRIVRDALKDEPPSRVPKRAARPVSTPRASSAQDTDPTVVAGAAAGATAAAAPNDAEEGSAPVENQSADQKMDDTPVRATVPFDDEAT